ncbi:MAG: carboxypeptidase M32 [Alphaproteobacteria bacterium]|nr:carboxypeptidase M32 [Alphaproteobacteria bacterium]
MNTEEAWNEVARRANEQRDLQGLMAVAQWDQQVMLPPAGAAARGRQLAAISGIRHERLTDPRLGALLEQLAEGTEDPVRDASVRLFLKEHRQAVRTPSRLVRAFAEARARAHATWMEARAARDFTPFAPSLTELVGLIRETVDARREPHHADPYDVLLDEYDPGSTVAALDPMFARLSAELGAFLDTLRDRPHPPGFDGAWPVPAQRALNEAVVQALGFDLTRRGRMDHAEHPFTVGVAPDDVRLTTHLYPDALLSGLSGTIHETGHGLYEQGLPKDWYGLPVGAPASFGLHESQSRFWENVIGRSLPFFRWLQGPLQEHLGGDIPSPEQLYAAANRVERSLIRIFADEVTYNLHIVVRYQLERALLSGALTVADLPDAWDDGYEAVLGVRADNPTDGVLQDVHWSAGLFAYFPSYTLGNLYAASILARLEEDLPDLWTRVEAGDFTPILGWLRAHIHSKGHLVHAPAILQDALGERDHVADLMAYIRGRHGALYSVY